MTKESRKKQVSAKNSGEKTKKASCIGVGEALESTGHLMQLHKLQGALLAKLRKQIEYIDRKL